MWVAQHTAVSQLVYKFSTFPNGNKAAWSGDKRSSSCTRVLLSKQCQRFEPPRSGLSVSKNKNKPSRKLQSPTQKLSSLNLKSSSNLHHRNFSLAQIKGSTELIEVTATLGVEWPRRLCREAPAIPLRRGEGLRPENWSQVAVIQERDHIRRSCSWVASSSSGIDPSMAPEETEMKAVPANALEYVHRVALDVMAPPHVVWTLWTDLKNAPHWMRWIDRVEFLTDDESVRLFHELPPGLSKLSRWICSTAGFEVMWVARVEFVESAPPVRVLRWATVDGLQSRGEVTFQENSNKGTTVELSISHSLPAALGRVMQSNALRGLVQATLQSDLERFQKYAAEAVGQQGTSNTGKQEGPDHGTGGLTITTNCDPTLGDLP